MSSIDRLVPRLEQLLDRLDILLPPAPSPLDWEQVIALRWRQRHGQGHLQAVPTPSGIDLADLLGIDQQKSVVDLNTRQFIQELPANNVLLWGARGTGKSSLIKALLNTYKSMGLRLVQVDREGLIDLPDIVTTLRDRPERFIVWCDDLSFEAHEPGYKALKTVLDGVGVGGNVLVYATSNRRHLLPEFHEDNRDTQWVGEEIHPGETVEEKISLSERFGLWLSFYPFSQEQYLAIVGHWLAHLGVEKGEALTESLREAALGWALAHGSRSGRSAWQFARDWVGRLGLDAFP